MREPVDPFASIGTSNVFFQIVLGRTAPNDIAKYLGTKPPGVVEHLRKLQDIGVLELGDKEGKYQNYRINWEKFVEALFEHIYTPRLQAAVLKLEGAGSEREKLVLEQKTLEAVIAELKKSARFRDVVRGYFEVMVMNMNQGLYPQRTIWGAIYCFEESLWSLPRLWERAKIPGMRKFLRLLEKWDDCAQRFKQHGPREAFSSSVWEAFKPKD